jgi:HD-like signal output (HDOD) protein
VGFALARAWQLPDDVLFAIARSDRYSVDGAPSPVNLVCLANAIAKRAGIYQGTIQEEAIDAIIQEGADLFDLNSEDISQLMDLVQPVPDPQQATTARPKR